METIFVPCNSLSNGRRRPLRRDVSSTDDFNSHRWSRGSEFFKQPGSYVNPAGSYVNPAGSYSSLPPFIAAARHRRMSSVSASYRRRPARL